MSTRQPIEKYDRLAHAINNHPMDYRTPYQGGGRLATHAFKKGKPILRKAIIN